MAGHQLASGNKSVWNTLTKEDKKDYTTLSPLEKKAFMRKLRNKVKNETATQDGAPLDVGAVDAPSTPGDMYRPDAVALKVPSKVQTKTERLEWLTRIVDDPDSRPDIQMKACELLARIQGDLGDNKVPTCPVVIQLNLAPSAGDKGPMIDVSANAHVDVALTEDAPSRQLSLPAMAFGGKET